MSGLFSRKKKKKKKEESDPNYWDNLQKMNLQMMEEKTNVLIIDRRIDEKKARLEARGKKLDEMPIRDKYRALLEERYGPQESLVDVMGKYGYSEDDIKKMSQEEFVETVRKVDELRSDKPWDRPPSLLEESEQEASIGEMMEKIKYKAELVKKLLRELEAAYDEALAKLDEE